MILIGIKVGRHNHTVTELSSGKSLLGLLTIQHRVELHKHLKNHIISQIQ